MEMAMLLSLFKASVFWNEEKSLGLQNGRKWPIPAKSRSLARLIPIPAQKRAVLGGSVSYTPRGLPG
jgi:hypothetical protein